MQAAGRTVERVKRTEHDGFILKPFHRHELQSTIQVASSGEFGVQKRRFSEPLGDRSFSHEFLT